MIPTAARRGLQDIRTNAGRVTAPGNNQRAYMRLCTLEMERQRRQHEHAIAAQQAATAKERLDKLEREMAELTTFIQRDSRRAPQNPTQSNQPNNAQQSDEINLRYGNRQNKPRVNTKKVAVATHKARTSKASKP